MSKLSKLFLGVILATYAVVAYASVTVTVNGTSYTIPQTNEKGWGTNVTSWIQGISSASLYPNSGTFTLGAELDFGANYGIKSLYYKSRSSNVASTGKIRLANTDDIVFRNSGNSGNLILTPGASDGLINYNGVPLVTTTASQTLTNKTVDVSANTFTNIANSNVSASAAIARTKIANGTASQVVVNDGSGTLSSEATLAITRGGTGQATANAGFNALSPMTTGGDLIYGGASGAATRLANGSANQVLTSAGGTSAPTWSTPQTLVLAPPTMQSFTSSSGTYNKNYTFVISSGSATVGATYTNNAITYTVYATVSSATLVVMSGSGAPAASGTLTKASGTGDSTLTFSSVKAPLYLKVRMVGGGGGGGQSGTSGTGGSSTNGGNTTFGSSLLTANGGTGGASGGSDGSAGGSATIASPAYGQAVTGTSGRGANVSVITTPGGSSLYIGSAGGQSPFGGSGGAKNGAATAESAVANTGSGGQGGYSDTASNAGGGPGGAAGGYIDAIIPNPSATYSYAVGSGGTGGTAGTGGANAGNGGSGVIFVTEYYQ
jgi:hypothetical protein